MTVISVDLDIEQFGDVGVVALRNSDSSIGVAPIRLPSVGLVGKPNTNELGAFLVSLADELNANFIVVNGPQGWKAPDDGLDHSRRCEHELSTPTRTGLPGKTKPADRLGFTKFSISLFDELSTLLYPRLSTTGDWPTHVAVESCPTAAWQSLGIAAPSVREDSTSAAMAGRRRALENCFPMDVRGELSYADLEATVAGMAGVALESRNLAGLAFAGVEPLFVDGTWREGYILNPTRDAATEPA